MDANNNEGECSQSKNTRLSTGKKSTSNVMKDTSGESRFEFGAKCTDFYALEFILGPVPIGVAVGTVTGREARRRQSAWGILASCHPSQGEAST